MSDELPVATTAAPAPAAEEAETSTTAPLAPEKAEVPAEPNTQSAPVPAAEEVESPATTTQPAPVPVPEGVEAPTTTSEPPAPVSASEEVEPSAPADQPAPVPAPEETETSTTTATATAAAPSAPQEVEALPSTTAPQAQEHVETTAAAPESAAAPEPVEAVEPAVESAPAAEPAPAAEHAPAVEAETPATATPAETPSATATTAATSPPAPAPEEDKPVAAPEETKTPEPATPLQELWATAKAHEYPEIWGVTLADPSTHIPSQIVLQKYLNANDGDVAKAKDQLTKTLDWRKKMQPLELIKQSFSREKFGGLGYITTYSKDGEEKGEQARAKEIFTWNVYGNVKSIDVSFGALDEFIKWRVALMELAVQELSLSTATEPITADSDADPYKMFQVHDYKGVSFLRQAPQVKTASTETIRVFATAYPELLKEKFFVNVPAVMGFMYSFMKLFVAARTIKKFHPLPNGANLAKETFGGSKLALADLLPAEYGGKGADLKTQGTEPSVE